MQAFLYIKKDVIWVKEFILAKGREVGEVKWSQLWDRHNVHRAMSPSGLAVDSSPESPQVNKKQRLLEFHVA